MPHGLRQLGSWALGFANRARLGLPGHAFAASGGIGDALLCSAVFRELKLRSRQRIGFRTSFAELFRENSDVDRILVPSSPRRDALFHAGIDFKLLQYSVHSDVDDQDTPLNEHILATLCKVAGISGTVSLRPYLHLTPSEIAQGRIMEKQLVIQSSGRNAAHYMRNKEWFPERFQEVCSALRGRYGIIQLGSKNDSLIDGAMDLRGQTTLRQSAAILANSLLFIGLVGFPMHLARSVDCRSVIVYGGRERPEETGYIANSNVIGNTPCSPCWLRNRCDYHHACMDMIKSADVLAAAEAQIQRFGEALEVQSVRI